MNWKHVQLIYKREMVDQLRDRRTIFTITILPLLLYPLLGMLMMQVAQFHRESPVKVLVLGHENWPSDLPLVDADGKIVLQSVLADSPPLLEFSLQPWPGSEDIDSYARQQLLTEKVDAVLVVPADMSSKILELSTEKSTEKDSASDSDNASAQSKMDTLESRLLSRGKTNLASGLSLFTNMARDQSSIAQGRVSRLIDLWWDQWRTRQMIQAGLAPSLSAPIRLNYIDTSVSSVRQAVRWSKVLPFVMLVWALTGAFYPAVDLCAGEKERGTLETLLSSPARRREIVWGKLLTINTFSIGSALLNLMSMQFTAGLVVRSLAASGTGDIAQALGPMPFHSMGWLVLLLIPMSAFFSALALAVAALAKSSKEGQYYLMPLLLVTLPLVGLPMELNLGNCLIPVSGAVFLVRSLIEGRYQEAVIHLPIVLLVTLLCCSMAIRWAVRQFESESVMFNEGGRWDLRSWLHHLWRDRQDTAQPSVALLCGVLILVVKFFAQFLISPTTSLTMQLVFVQVGMILMPCVIMAVLLTRSPRRALRIHRVQISHVLAAVMIGFALHPSYKILGEAILDVYPIAPETVRFLEQFQQNMLKTPLWSMLILMAVLPAICEELAYRGFIFGGLLRQQGLLRAIVVSAVLFGFTHAILQQSISASVMGLLLGLIAWRTGGVICTIIVHLINNALTLTMAWCGENQTAVPDLLTWIFKADADGWSYQPSWHFTSIVLSIALMLILFQRSRRTERSVLAEMV
jgi:sodium transport system permease protein